MKKDAQNQTAQILLHRFLLVFALITVRAPVAHVPNLRNPTSIPNSITRDVPPLVVLNNNSTSNNDKGIDITYNKIVSRSDHLVEISDSSLPDLNPRSMSKSRVYADVNVLRPKDYWDYESLTVQWG
ncbi:hypothetical protein RCOM_0396320 [Ricinus communis]|uniref:Uncharacterized protein n=2 Tax=Ricinus communis TaxID=3988 RepID=B9T4J1_RICCO|nr:hypothetical protein RCOM_0396320 [Ricinus communis]